MRRGCFRGALLLLAALVGGCARQEAAPAPERVELTLAQQAAGKEFAALLQEQIQVMEKTATVLSAVREDRASQDAALTKLVQLAIEEDAVTKRIAKEQPADAAVMNAAQELVLPRMQQAKQGVTEQVNRINRMPGGPDFFEKQLRPLLDVIKRN